MLRLASKQRALPGSRRPELRRTSALVAALAVLALVLAGSAVGRHAASAPGGSWRAAVTLGPNAALSEVSCTSTKF